MREDKKWKNNSDKTRAYKLRQQINPKTNKNWTDEEILLLFYKQPVDNTKSSGPSHPPAPPKDCPKTFTLNDLETYLARCMYESQVYDPTLITNAIKLKEMQSKLQTQSEQQEKVSKIARSTTTSDLVSIIKPIPRSSKTQSNESAQSDLLPDNSHSTSI